MKKRPTFGVITAECYREHTAEMMSGILAQCTLADCNVTVPEGAAVSPTVR